MSKYIVDDAFTDDILIEVLKRVRVDKLFDFKCVCKRWDKIISSNYFRTSYQLDSRARGISTLIPTGFYISFTEYAFYPTCFQSCTNRAAPYFKTAGFRFVDSCNGLLLFHNSRKRVYRVCNPVIKKWRDIDEPYLTGTVAIAFDSPSHFRGFETLSNFSLTFLVASNFRNLCSLYTIFSSSTYCTDKCFQASDDISFENFECALVIKGVYYWLSLLNSILSYTPFGSQNVDNSPVKVISLPLKDNTAKDVSSVLSESKEGFIQYSRSDSFKIIVWVLYNNDDDDHNGSQWLFRYVVSYEKIRYQFPKCDHLLCWEDIVDIRYAKLVGCHPLHPEIVFILLNEMIISYCFQNRRVELVCRIEDTDKESWDTVPPWEWRRRIVPYFSPTWAASFLKPRLIVNVQCSESLRVEKPVHELRATPWLDALLGRVLPN